MFSLIPPNLSAAKELGREIRNEASRRFALQFCFWVSFSWEKSATEDADIVMTPYMSRCVRVILLTLKTQLKIFLKVKCKNIELKSTQLKIKNNFWQSNRMFIFIVFGFATNNDADNVFFFTYYSNIFIISTCLLCRAVLII